MAAWSQFAACCPARGEANLPTTSKSTEGLPQTPAFLPSFLNSISQPILLSLPSNYFLVFLHEAIPISRNNRPAPAHLSPTSAPPLSAARHQPDKMAPEPTPDHPEHKKKVNLTYVVALEIPALFWHRGVG